MKEVETKSQVPCLFVLSRRLLGVDKVEKSGKLSDRGWSPWLLLQYIRASMSQSVFYTGVFSTVLQRHVISTVHTNVKKQGPKVPGSGSGSVRGPLGS